MDEQRLFRGALAAVSVSAHWSYPAGWSVVIAARWEGEDWDPNERWLYTELSTGEMADVVGGVLDVLVG